MQTFDTVIYDILENFKRNVSNGPLYLGGVSTYSGGVGGPNGGFIGKLPQTQVTYDMSEDATDYTPLSGYTLLDNLNHIRYRIDQVENGTSVIMKNDTVIASGITILQFDDSFNITPITSGVHISAVVSGVTNLADSQYVQHVYNEVVTSLGTSHSTAQKFLAGSLRVYLNGVRQDPTQYTEDGDFLGFTTTFSVPSGMILSVEYDIAAYGESSGGSAPIIVQQDGTVIASGITILNFSGDVVVSEIPSGVDIVITASGTSGSYVETAGDTMTGDLNFTDKGIHTVDYIDFNTAVVTSGILGRLQWNNVDKCLEFTSETDGSTTINQLGQEIWIRVRNNTGSTINNATPVYVTGALGNRPTIAKAKADSEATSLTYIGLTTEDIQDNDDGFVTIVGSVRGVNTLAYDIGNILYVSATTAGELTATRPTAPNQVIAVGIVTVKSGNGEIGITARIQPNLERLSDVYVASVANNDVLQYNSSTLRWENKQIVASGTGGGIEEAPIDGYIYGRRDSDWVVISGIGGISTSTFADRVVNELITTTGTDFSTAKTFLPNSLQVYFNGVRQDTSHYDEKVTYNGFTTDFTVTAEDILFVDYDCESTTFDNGTIELSSSGILFESPNVNTQPEGYKNPSIRFKNTADDYYFGELYESINTFGSLPFYTLNLYNSPNIADTPDGTYVSLGLYCANPVLSGEALTTISASNADLNNSLNLDVRVTDKFCTEMNITNGEIDLDIHRTNSTISARLRPSLTEDVTFYVRTDGSDSNDGLANTAAGAFLTIQKAVDTVSILDIGGKTVTIQIADGTYTDLVALKNVAGYMLVGNLVIQGNATTPGNVIISTAGTAFLADALTCDWTIKNLKIQTTANGYCIQAKRGSKIDFSGIEFGTCAASHLRAEDGATIICNGNYSISGSVASAHSHWNVAGGGSIRTQSKTITITNTPAFGGGFAAAIICGSMLVNGNTFSGSATGKRYSVVSNGVIYTNGAASTYLPGDTAGTTATGGQYV